MTDGVGRRSSFLGFEFGTTTIISSNNAATPPRPSSSHRLKPPTANTDREASPSHQASPSRRLSTFAGLNVLKKGRSQSRPSLSREPSPHASSRSPDASVVSANDAPPVPSLPAGTIHGQRRSSEGPNAPRGRSSMIPNSMPDLSSGQLSPLPLPPTILGATGTSTREPSRNSQRGSPSRRPGTSGSASGGSRPGTRDGPGEDLENSFLYLSPTPGDAKPKEWRRSFFSGKLQKKSPGNANGVQLAQETAFVITPTGRRPYDMESLLKSQPIPELWDENGNLFVHLFPNAKPCIKLHSSMIADSRGLRKLIDMRNRGRQRRSGEMRSPTHQRRHMSHGDRSDPDLWQRRRRSESVGSPEPLSPTGDDDDLHLHLNMACTGETPSHDDISNIVAMRNLFAFLVGQVLVGTPKLPNLFPIFNSIAVLLRRYEFSNIDGSTFGAAAESAFLGYVSDLRLDDLRRSREKTMEGLVLGERMKCWTLYNEAYVHSVGKWNDIVSMKSPTFNQISSLTKNRTEKSLYDLNIRLKEVRDRLEEFQFPSLFAGVAQSSSTGKEVDPSAWRSAWTAMRRHVISHYKKTYGSWPPKAKSKKNEFDQSGLNRLLLQEVYQDFTDLYDLLVDRTNLTSRSVDSSHGETLGHDANSDKLRKLMSEFDRSGVPVRPPVPYDLPQLPIVTSTRRDFASLPPKKQEKERSKRVKDNDLTLTLMASYNRDSLKNTPFIEAFMQFERHSASGKSVADMANLRIGHWIFLYVVLQALPLLVVDAPGLRWTLGVEYFLCEVPKGSPPWTPGGGAQTGQNAYYRVQGGSGVVSLPADVVEHGVEGIYRRSHCWTMASRWSGLEATSLLPNGAVTAGDPSRSVSLTGTLRSDAELTSPGGTVHSEVSAAGSVGGLGGMLVPPSLGGARMRSSVALGLEALPLPPQIVNGADPLGSANRRISAPDPTKSFDNILGQMPQVDAKKGGKKKNKG